MTSAVVWVFMAMLLMSLSGHIFGEMMDASGLCILTFGFSWRLHEIFKTLHGDGLSKVYLCIPLFTGLTKILDHRE